ncbi:hypothetical protein V8E53_013345 [Lactarius tabidus]
MPCPFNISPYCLPWNLSKIYLNSASGVNTLSSDRSVPVIEDAPPLNVENCPAIKFWYKKQRGKEVVRRWKLAQQNCGGDDNAVEEEVDFHQASGDDGDKDNEEEDSKDNEGKFDNDVDEDIHAHEDQDNKEEADKDNEVDLNNNVDEDIDARAHHDEEEEDVDKDMDYPSASTSNVYEQHAAAAEKKKAKGSSQI